MANTIPPFEVEFELGQDHPGQADGLVERQGLGQPVLAGRRIEHEDRLGSRSRQTLVDDAPDLRQLVHQVDLGMETAGGIGDDEVDVASDRRV